jgi:hypothetical protein
MPGVFISYRRADTKGFAGALLRDLSARLGADQVFMDTEDIQGGTHFPSVLEAALESCDVLVALIGPQWLEARDASGRRLDDPADFVRREIARGLQRGVRVIPVLVDGTPMPSADRLPPDLQALATRHALTLGNIHWDEDVARLTDHAREAMFAEGVRNAAGARPSPDFAGIPPMVRKVKLFVGVSLGFGILFVVIGASTAITEWRFGTRAARARGEVVDLIEEQPPRRAGEQPRMREEDARPAGPVYRAVILFSTADGRAVRFLSRLATNPPAYKLGEQVMVLYDPGHPETASIDSFADRWLGVVMWESVAALCLLASGVPLGLRAARQRRLRTLLRDGRPIITSFHAVEQDDRIALNGRHPFVVVTEWRNPVSQQLVHFRSQHVWDDPTERARKRMVTVVVDPNNFRRYFVDLSFLKARPASKA